jgi:hypothetical protein
MNTIDTSRGSG